MQKMMHMTFYWGKKVTLLFDFWRTDSWLNYAATLLVCLLFSIFYQYLEDRRLRFKMLSKTRGSAPVAVDSSAAVPLLYSRLGIKSGQWTASKFAGSVLFAVNSGIGYLLMLAVMSFNSGVFVAVVVGLGLGYLFFRSSDDDLTLVVDNPCACA